MEYLLSLIEIPQPLALRRAEDFCLAGIRHLKDHFIPHARNNHPHILGNRVLGLMSIALVGVKILTIALLSFGPVLPAFSSAITPDNIITLTNQSRQDYNLGDLTENSQLDKAAQAKADDMLAKGYFAHVTPDGKTPWDFITAAGYNYMMAGENLAVNFSQAEDVETAWMNSPGHKANILNKNFQDIGIGIAQGQFQGHTATFVVQEFGMSAEQKIALTTTPTRVQTTKVPPPALATSDNNPSSNIQGAQTKTPSPTVEPLAISQAQTQANGDSLAISATVNGNPVKVLAYFGDKGVMLAPQDNNNWTGQVSLSELASGNQAVHIKAFDIRGQSVDYQLADFTNSTIGNFNVVAPQTPAPVKVAWYGHLFDPKTVEGKFYLYFIAGLLASMVLAIGVKRHVQHLNLIANSSFVVILACLLFMAR